MKIFNPTLDSIQVDSDLWTHYQTPRMFNEILSLAKNASSHLIMSQDQNRFILKGEHRFFVFSIQLQKDLDNIFVGQNTSFAFIRFCMSLERLANDEDVLESLPQLLTSKLPLFEFQKNQTRF